MPDNLQTRYDSARSGLTRLLEHGRPPQILEVLRGLKTEILRCFRNGATQSQMLRVLNDCGFEFSRTGFSYAYRMLLYEEGVMKLPAQQPTALKAPRPLPLRLVPPLKPARSGNEKSTANAPAVSSSSIRDLLAKGI